MLYQSPQSTKEVVDLLKKSKGSVHILAGGSDLLVKMKSGFVEPDLVVDIKRVKSMKEIKKTAKGISIGAAVSCAAQAQHAALAKAWPGIVEAACLIGSDQIQSRCTMVGNLCNASPAADSVPALIAADASVQIIGPKGKRTVKVDKVVTAPGKTSLKKGEFIDSLQLPARKARSADAYLRFTPRTEMDIAVVSAAVNLTIDSKKVVTEARVCLGAVAATAVLVPAAAKALIGSKLDDKALEKMADACASACKPIDDKRGTVDFRIKVAKVLGARAAKLAYSRAGGN